MDIETMDFWRAVPDGVTVMVKVQPRSRRPGLQGRAESATGQRLKIAVTEPAESGRANHAVCAALAKALDVPRSAVKIVNGATNREKLLSISGNATALAEKLKSL